ncbi:uncharacterized protein LOC108627825 isoform X2 [Ceratina calcarata]|nr:uncharacterized protein LOC108627825 isoform X2 [Ceratina calcarata]
MDLLPKHMCHRCSYKLEEFHKFYVDCLKTDASLKSQLSWMRKEDSKETSGVPMVHIENLRIKMKPLDYDLYDVKPIVNDVGYMNSLGFPVNSVPRNDGITYTAYAPCDYYCDKTDQSNQAISTNFEDDIANCSKINEMTEDNCCTCIHESNARSNLFETRIRIKEEYLEDEDLNGTHDLNTSRKNSKDAIVRGSKSTIVRNLRPRKSVINYMETRMYKSRSKNVDVKVDKPALTDIKVEKMDNFERGIVLRPRNGTINYFQPSRKCSTSLKKDRRSREVPNIAGTLKNIKKEELSDAEDKSVMLLSNETLLALPKDVNIRTDRISCSTFKLGLSLRNGKSKLNRSSSPKYLRSQDVHLRNGKIRKRNVEETKLGRSFRNLADRGRKRVKNLLQTIGDVHVKKIRFNVKHYCEECNMSFVNTELYRLHTCCGH